MPKRMLPEVFEYLRSLGKKYGSQGGKTAAKNMTAEERLARAKKASLGGSEDADGGTTRGRGHAALTEEVKHSHYLRASSPCAGPPCTMSTIQQPSGDQLRCASRRRSRSIWRSRKSRGKRGNNQLLATRSKTRPGRARNRFASPRISSVRTLS